jgi:hypothetical protein
MTDEEDHALTPDETEAPPPTLEQRLVGLKRLLVETERDRERLLRALVSLHVRTDRPTDAVPYLRRLLARHPELTAALPDLPATLEECRARAGPGRWVQ